MLEAFPSAAITQETLAELRLSVLTPLPFDYGGDTESVNLDTRDIPGPGDAPAVGVRIYRPSQGNSRRGCILYLHGGGFISGSAAMLDPLHRSLVAELDCVLVSADYRLAPETPFPGAIEDCYAALAWVHGNCDELGVDPTRIGVMGESAGGGLAAALALLARDRGEYKLVFQHLMYPMLDDRTCTSTDIPAHAGEFLWTRRSNDFGWSALLGHAPGAVDVSPYAAPARAVDLAGMPPTFLAIGALDLFLEEDIEYARRLLHAGVPVDLHVYAGAVHGFDLIPTTELARRARRESVAALARALSPGQAASQVPPIAGA